MTVQEFLQNINYAPLYPQWIRQPKDSFGLTVVSFPKVGNKQITIEFGDDGKVYSELLDYTTYKDGDIIPLNENEITRKIIVKYEPLTQETYKSIANKINIELDKLYMPHLNKTEKELSVNILYNQLVMFNYMEDLMIRLDSMEKEYDEAKKD